MALTLNEYQMRAKATAIYPGSGGIPGMVYVGLKLPGEAGELAEKIGKLIRDKGFFNHGVITKADQIGLVKEAGDVLWYLAALANELGVTLEEVAQMNLDKLESRQSRGVLQGSGDDR